MTRKPTAKVAKSARERVTALARIQRPELLDFLLGDFWKLPVLSSAAVKDAATRTYYHGDSGWIVPVGSLGRKGEEATASLKDARSTAESIRIWIGKNLPEVDLQNVAVAVETIDGECFVAIYRK
jgi:hypothetical protein